MKKPSQRLTTTMSDHRTGEIPERRTEGHLLTAAELDQVAAAGSKQGVVTNLTQGQH
jgi:hypothetical protein